MNCWFCDDNMIWGGDHNNEDYNLPGDGIVVNLSCQGCGAFTLTYSNIKGENDGKKKNDKS
tara:strand:+ start:26104 stop:26286 length:183 start_codon:yes stop_codon:yes gene_type:complete